MTRTLHLQETTAAALLNPETTLERKLLTIPEFSNGLHWGTPRFGHPEGKILFHVKDVLDNVDKLSLPSQQDRERLRVIAMVHDTFKYQEGGGRHPRDWNMHHAVIARRFMENHSQDRSLLNIIQWHDEAYYCWRLSEIYRNPSDGKERLTKLIDQIGPDLQTYYHFFLCDTRTDGKNQAPIKWIETHFSGITPTKI
ncbi:MAG: hypothetical protein ACI8YQ_000187 [Polaribacter sp.]|jgi:hypothetical protein